MLSKFEKLSNLRVIESGLFKGLMLDDIKQAGRCLPFQDGCIDFFEKIVKEKKLNTDLHLLSFCWCGDLIRSAFTKGIDFNYYHSECSMLSFNCFTFL